MKKYQRITEDEFDTYYVGTADEVRNLYRHMEKNPNHNYWPLFAGTPKLNPDKIYALCIDELCGNFYVVTADVMLQYIMCGEATEN